MKIIAIPLLLASSSLIHPLTAQSEDCFFSNIGTRIGIDAEEHVSLSSYEVYSNVDLNWSWSLSENLRLDLSIETALGALTGENEKAAYGRIAPLAELHYAELPVHVVFSSGPSLYSQSSFDDYDIGGNFHFTSSIGCNWALNETWAIGYRFQHTSNANLNKPNPGLDMHTVNIAYAF
jgi:hypothetical protein